MSDRPPIPDDLEHCQRLLLDLLRRNDELRQQAQEVRQEIDAARRQAEDRQRRLDELQRVLAATAADYSQLQHEHAEVLETLALLRRYVFGPRRERVGDDPAQGHLFDVPELVIAAAATEPTVPEAASAPDRAPSARSRRRTSWDHLPQIHIEHDVPEQEKTCSCCGGRKERIGEDRSRELEFIPAKLEVKVHVLPKYACPKCRDGVTSPPVPPKPIVGGIAGPGLVSFVLVSKFAEHSTL